LNNSTPTLSASDVTGRRAAVSTRLLRCHSRSPLISSPRLDRGYADDHLEGARKVAGTCKSTRDRDVPAGVGIDREMTLLDITTL
jgi:hypothetical protein